MRKDKVSLEIMGKLNEDFWNPGKYFRLLKDMEDIDTEKWNNAKSQKERDDMVRPFLQEFWDKYKEEMSEPDIFDLFDDMEDSNYHTEYRILRDIICGKKESVKVTNKKSLKEAGEKIQGYLDVEDPSTKPKKFNHLQELRDYIGTNPYGFISNSASLCPKCDAPLGTVYGYNMKHKGMEFDDDGWLSIPWKCRKCGTSGIAIFQTEYWSQGVFTVDGMVEVRNCGIEPKW